MNEIKGSSLLTGHDYDPASKTMTLVFNNGTTGTFAGVPPEKYDAFLAADSKGKWYHANLRGNPDHPYSKVEVQEDKE